MIEVGNRVRLLKMDDPQGIPPGTEGVVTDSTLIYLSAPDQYWQVSVNWDNGSSLMMCVPPDEYEVLKDV